MNCNGSLDGKHCSIFANTGSTDYNYTGIFSTVLMGLYDKNGMFTAIYILETMDGIVTVLCFVNLQSQIIAGQ